jgi:hypothetical protein
MGFKVTKFVAPEPVNPYLEDVAAFAKENADNPEAAIEVDVPAKDQGKTELQIRKAANAVGKTARLRKVDTSQKRVTGQTEKGRDIVEGVVILTYTLTEKHKGGKGRKPAAETAEAPAKASK